MAKPKGPARMYRRGLKYNRNPNLDPDRMRREGEDHGRAILTNMKVVAIYQDRRKHAVIAKEYGVARSTVSGIKAGDRWGFLTYNLHYREVSHET